MQTEVLVQRLGSRENILEILDWLGNYYEVLEDGTIYVEIANVGSTYSRELGDGLWEITRHFKEK